MGLAAHQRSIELLHMIGAQDSYVARQFQNHALRFGLRGGLIGLLGALPTLYLARLLLQRIDSGLLPELSFRPHERTAESRVGRECVSQCRSRGSRDHEKTKTIITAEANI